MSEPVKKSDYPSLHEYAAALEERVKDSERAYDHCVERGLSWMERAEQAEAAIAAEKLNVKIAMTQRDKHRQARKRAEWMLQEVLADEHLEEDAIDAIVRILAARYEKEHHDRRA